MDILVTDVAQSSLEIRAKFAAIITVLAMLFWLPAQLASMYFLSRYAVYASDGRAATYITWFIPSIWQKLLGLAAFGYMLLFAASVVIIAMWVARAHRNLRVLGLSGLNYAPWWAVLSFFVPLVNMLIPYRAMRELCNRSYGETIDGAAVDVPDVTAWWTCTLTAGFLSIYLNFSILLGRFAGIHLVAPLAMQLAISAIHVFLVLLSAVYILRIIRLVTLAQRSTTGIQEIFA